MCHYSCEKCELVIWNEKFGHFIAKVESGNILENVKKLLNKVENKVWFDFFQYARGEG